VILYFESFVENAKKVMNAGIDIEYSDQLRRIKLL